MEEKSFRVLLDLSEINISETDVKYVWMFVSPQELNTIFDLKRAINKKIPLLQENYKLFLRNGLLLENEKVSILREDDTIKLKLENFHHSFQECSIRSLNQIVADIPPDKPINCDPCNSKRSKKRKCDIFISSGKESSSSRKQKKKKQDSSQKSASENESVIDIASILSCVVSEVPNENHEKIFFTDTKKVDSLTNDEEHPAKTNSKSKPHKNETISCDFIRSTENKKMDVYKSDLNVANSQEINLENESSQKLKGNSKSKTVTRNSVSHALTHSLKIGKSADELDLTCTDINLEIVNLENEVSPTEVSLEACTPKQSDHKKRKRKRKRKRKNLEVAFDSSAQINPLEFDLSLNNFRNTPEKGKHTIYKSPISSPKIIETVTLDPDFITYSELPDTSQSLSKSNMECDGLSELDISIAKFIEENQSEESVSGNHQNTLSTLADMSLKISTHYAKKSKRQSWGITPLSRNSNTASNTITIEDPNTPQKRTSFKSYSEYLSLNCMPQVGTKLAFKVLELNEKYCPEVTDYKEGIIRNIDPNTDELTIELLQEELKLGRTGKFENLKEDEIPPNEIIKTVKLSWSALINPKEISSK